MLTIFISVADCLSELSQIPLYGFIFNFGAGFIGAFLFLRLPLQPDIDSAKKYMRFLDDLRKENLSKDYFFYTLKYCLAAGVASAIVVQLQFGRFNVVYAFLYGVAGPYALRKQISERLLKRPVDRAVGSTLTNSDEIIMEYDKVKEQISRRLDELNKGQEKHKEENSQRHDNATQDSEG